MDETNCSGNNHMNNGTHVKSPFLIAVAGGTASGKSTVCKKIMERLGKEYNSQSRVALISQDSFYRPLNEEESVRAQKGEFNFDHPEAFDTELILDTLKKIKNGQICKIPEYDFVTSSRTGEKTVYPADVVLFEGILMFYQKEVRELFHMKLFVDSDADTRLARRVIRDTRDRGRNLDNILNQYTKLVKPAFEEFCLPTKKFADVIIPRGSENIVAINLIVLQIEELLHNTLQGGQNTSDQLKKGVQHHSPNATPHPSSPNLQDSLAEDFMSDCVVGPPVLSPSSSKARPVTGS